MIRPNTEYIWKTIWFSPYEPHTYLEGIRYWFGRLQLTQVEFMAIENIINNISND